jgi:hypothetical protein
MSDKMLDIEAQIPIKKSPLTSTSSTSGLLLTSTPSFEDPLNGKSPKPSIRPWNFPSSPSPTSPSPSPSPSGVGKRLAFSSSTSPSDEGEGLEDKLLMRRGIPPYANVGGGGQVAFHQGATKQFMSVTHPNVAALRGDNNTITSMDSTTSTSLYRNANNNNENTMTNTSTVDSTTFRKIRNRMSSKYGRMRKRVVFKNGDCNLHQTNISKRRRKYLADIFVTLVDLQALKTTPTN